MLDFWLYHVFLVLVLFFSSGITPMYLISCDFIKHIVRSVVHIKRVILSLELRSPTARSQRVKLILIGISGSTENLIVL